MTLATICARYRSKVQARRDLSQANRIYAKSFGLSWLTSLMFESVFE